MPRLSTFGGLAALAARLCIRSTSYDSRATRRRKAVTNQRSSLRGRLEKVLVAQPLVYMRYSIIALCIVVATRSLGAQTSPWQPSPGHRQMPIWPGAVPDARPAPDSESIATAPNLVAGKPWVVRAERFATHADGLFAEGKEHRRRGRRVPRRRLSDSRDRSRRYRSLRLADVQGDHVRAVEVPRAAFGAVVGHRLQVRASIRSRRRRWRMRSGR